MRICGIILVAAMLSGCAATYDQRMATDFIPTADGWTYKTFADIANPIDSDIAERYRIQMLEIWLTENAMCSNGYTIKNKQSIRRNGPVFDVYYFGSCA